MVDYLVMLGNRARAASTDARRGADRPAELRANGLELGAQRDLVALSSGDLPTASNQLTPLVLGDVALRVDTAVKFVGVS